jgi:hypothetical protein
MQRSVHAIAITNHFRLVAPIFLVALLSGQQARAQARVCGRHAGDGAGLGPREEGSACAQHNCCGGREELGGPELGTGGRTGGGVVSDDRGRGVVHGGWAGGGGEEKGCALGDEQDGAGFTFVWGQGLFNIVRHLEEGTMSGNEVQ